jgi:uncharacterized protein GlcG (DUF336 family)
VEPKTAEGLIRISPNREVNKSLEIINESDQMRIKHYLESADVKSILASSEAEAHKNNWAVSIAVVDDGGHLLGFSRLDGAAAFSAHMAPAKAHTAALARRETKIYEDIINNGRYAFLTAPDVDGMLEGGVPILKDGQVIGAVGVSGVKSTEDVQIAKAGIEAFYKQNP